MFPSWHTLVLLPLQTLHTTLLRRRLLLFAKQQAAESSRGLDSDNPAKRLLAARPVTSIAAQAAGEDATYVRRDLLRVGSALVQVGGQMWGCFLQHVSDLLQSGLWSGIVLGKSRRYDETPLKVRLRDSHKVGGAGGTAFATKIMQTQMKVFCLLKRESDGSFLHFEGRVPTQLQAMESSAAPIVMSSQQATENTIGNLQTLSAQFKLNVTLVCTDRHASNACAEHLLHEQQKAFVKSHTFCAVHCASTCLKAATSLVEGHISGLIAVAQCMQVAGATECLRADLREIVAARLQVRWQEPQCEQHRNFVYNMCLGPVTTKRSGKQRLHLLHKQRYILNALFNGDIQQDDVVIHCCTRDRTKEAVLQDMFDFGVPALLPHVCPTINRGSFLGHEDALRWGALLACHHNLLKPVILKFCTGQAQVPKPPAPQPVSWSQLAALRALPDATDMPGEAAAATPTEGSEQAAAPEAIILVEDGDAIHSSENISWQELNKANKKKACLYVAQDPGPVLLLTLVAMLPAQELMMFLIGLGSEAWDWRQFAEAARGHARSFRIVELLKGKELTRYFQRVSMLLNSSMQMLPARACTVSMRTLCFRMLSRNASAVHMILRTMHRSSAFMMFANLLDEAEAGGLTRSLPPCMRDPLHEWFMEAYPTEDARSSAEARALLMSLASIAEVDVLGIEARHSAARRLVHMQSVQTWGLEFARLAAEQLLRQQIAAGHRFLHANSNATQDRAVRAVRGRKINAGRGGHGGAWRVFMSQNASGKGRGRGSGITHNLGDASAQASVRYRAMRALGGQPWTRLVEAGRLATLAGRRGLLKRTRVREPLAVETATLEGQVRAQVQCLRRAGAERRAQEGETTAVALRCMQQNAAAVRGCLRDLPPELEGLALLASEADASKFQTVQVHVPAEKTLEDCGVCVEL